MIGLGRSMLGFTARLSLSVLVGIALYAPSVIAQECNRADIPGEFKKYLTSVSEHEALARYFSDNAVRLLLDVFSAFTPNEDLADVATVTNARLNFGNLFGEILKTRLSTSLERREFLKVVYHSKRFGAPRLVVLAYVCQGSLWRIDHITYKTEDSLKGWEDW